MIATVISEFTNREAGIASHLLAVAVCGVAWTRSRGKDRWPATLASLELFLLFDAVFHWRWELHEVLVRAAVNLNVYSDRTLPQEILSALFASATVAAAVAAIRSKRNRPGGGVALCGALISAVLWILQVISLHAIDAVFEHIVGPMRIIAWAWFGSSALVILGLLRMTVPSSSPSGEHGHRC